MTIRKVEELKKKNPVDSIKLEYFKGTDRLYIKISDRDIDQQQDPVNGVTLDFDENGELIGIEIEHFSELI